MSSEEREFIHESVFTFTGDDAEMVFRSIAPEMESETLSRSHAECMMSGESRILLRVCASDPSALRAALNMWLRLVNVAFEMKELIKQEGS
jgi:KEOPS complex subunit Pcc1